VLANMGITNPSRWQLFFTIATLVAVLNSVLGGAAFAFAAGLLGLPQWPAVGAGLVLGLLSLAGDLRWQRKTHVEGRAAFTVRFPTHAAA
jgi:hypothetical protein